DNRAPGLVGDVGPNWLAVAFTKGGEGVLLRLRNDKQSAVYALATRTADGKIALVSELPDPVVSQGDRRFQIIRGADAYLIVGGKDLTRVIDSRRRATGLTEEK